MEEIKRLLTDICKQLFDLDIDPELTRPDVKFGDYTTNIALVLSAKLNKTPRDVAVMISDKIDSTLISKIDIAGPGFLNISLTDEALVKTMIAAATKPLSGQVAVVEYSDPNPFKVLHAGHLYTSVVGDAIANLLETAGATVHRVNFGGDVGRHVAQTMWAIIDKLGGENPEKLSAIAENERAPWMAECYISGTAAFETNEDAKQLILELNKKYTLFMPIRITTPLLAKYIGLVELGATIILMLFMIVLVATSKSIIQKAKSLILDL